MKEIWKDIKGFENKYQCSTFGRIKTLDYKRTHQIRIMSQHKKLFITKDGVEHIYYRVSLYKNGKGKTYYVHCLIASTFPEICGELKNGYDVHHIDHNTENNHANNLMVVSKSEHCSIHNTGDRLSHGFKWTKNQRKRIVKSLQKPIIQMDLDNNEIFGWFSAKDCQDVTGIKRASISRVCNNKQKTAGGFKWRYAS